MNEEVSAKDYLLRVARQRHICDQVMEDVMEAESDAYGLRGVQISERVQTSSDPAWKINAAVEEVERLRRKYETEMERLIEIRNEVKASIRMLPNRRQVRVLELRYCRCMRLSQVAREIDRTEGHVRKVHGEALESFREIHGMK